MKVAETESMIDGTKLAESMFGNITLTMMVFLVIGKEAKLSTIHVYRGAYAPCCLHILHANEFIMSKVSHSLGKGEV